MRTTSIGFSIKKYMTILPAKRMTKIQKGPNPGDSMWPFYPLVGGHLTEPFKGSPNHPQKRSPAELPGLMQTS